jgi:endoglucanase
MDQVALLQRLSETFGPSGHEEDVRDAIVDVVKPLVDEMHVDRMGNVIATKRGRRSDVLLLDAHMDEVGFLVSYVDDAGFLRLSPLGGWDDRVLLSHAVTVRGTESVRGVIGTLPPHILSDDDRKRPIRLDDLFVDVGASSEADVRALGIDVGSPCVPSYPFERLSDDLVMGKAFDDRAGCTVAVGVLEALKDEETELTVVCAFTTSEELGLRGARVAVNQVAPVVALALEGTTAVDVPGVTGARRLASMGNGPALTIADRSLLPSREVLSLLEELAVMNAIPYQRKLPGGGGTDAAAIQTHGTGVLCGVVSVPCRYIHTPLSLLNPSDLDNAVRLTTAFAGAAQSLV